MATCAPRPSATLRSTKCVAALNVSGTPSDSAESPHTVMPSRIVRRSPVDLRRWSAPRKQRHDFVGKRPRRERRRVDTGDAVRRLADQAIGAALVDVEGEADPRSVISAMPTPTAISSPSLRRRSKPRLQRRARHEDVERAQQRGAIAAEPPVEILLGVLEIAEEDAEPDDAGGIGVGPHHAEVDVMEERHGPI